MILLLVNLIKVPLGVFSDGLLIEFSLDKNKVTVFCLLLEFLMTLFYVAVDDIVGMYYFDKGVWFAEVFVVDDFFKSFSCV